MTAMDVDADASDSGGLSFIICRDEVWYMIFDDLDEMILLF